MFPKAFGGTGIVGILEPLSSARPTPRPYSRNNVFMDTARGLASERLRLRVAVNLGGQEGFEVLVEGVAADCVGQIEFATLTRSRAAVAGFRLVLSDAVSPMPLTVRSLYEAALWGSGRLDVRAQFLRRDPMWLGPSAAEHGLWIHAAAIVIQARWRAHRRWQQRVDALDVLQVFEQTVGQKGMGLLQPAILLEGEWLEPAEAKVEPRVLQLAVAFAACGRQPMQIFRWLEGRAAGFCVRHAANYTESLEGLADPSCHPGVEAALIELTQCFVLRLGVAFPWLLERSCMAEAEMVASKAMRVAVGRRGTFASPGTGQRIIVAHVYSEVVSWALEQVEEAVSDLELRFENTALANRIAEMQCFPAVRSALMTLKPNPSRRWLVRITLEQDGLLEDVRNRTSDRGSEPTMLMPMEPWQNFGGVMRTACAFYNLEYAQLATLHGGEPLAVETTLSCLNIRGVFLALAVRSHSPEPGSFERALLDLAKAIGPSFRLDRKERILRLPQPQEKGSGGLGSRCDGGAISPWGLRRLSALGDLVVMPEDYNGQAQYYHFYNSSSRQMVSVRCPLSEVVGWVRLLGGLHGDPELSGVGQWEVNQATLLKELEMLHGNMKRSLSSAVGASCNLSQAWRNCGYAAPAEIPNDWGAAVCAARSVALSAAQRAAQTSLGSRLTLLMGLEPPVASAPAHSALHRAVSMFEAMKEQLVEHTAADAYMEEVASTEKANAKEELEEAAAVERRASYSDFLCTPRPPTFASTSSMDAETPGAAVLSDDDGLGLDDNKLGHSDLRTGSLVRPHLGPEVVSPAILAAAAASTPLLLVQPQVQWVMREVQAVVGSSAVLAPQSPTIVGLGVAAASGALGGAAIGSSLGPIGASLGALAGAALSGKAEVWYAARPQTMIIDRSHSYTLAHSPWGARKMYLSHKETSRGPGLEGLVVASLLPASLRGCGNLMAFAKGEMSGQDVVLSLLTDLRDGAFIWLSCNGVLKALSVGELRAGGVLGQLCGVALRHHVPVMFFVLGVGWFTLRHARCSLNHINREQLHADLVLGVSSNVAGIAVNLLCSQLGVPILGRIVLTCTASNAAGLCAYETWRASQQRRVEDKLRLIAMDVLGLAPGFTAEQLRCRWRVLARLAHPDRNTRPDAKLTFTVFTLCRDVLRNGEGANEVQRSASRASFRGLLRRLWRTTWVDHSDLPSTKALPPLYQQWAPEDRVSL